VVLSATKNSVRDRPWASFNVKRDQNGRKTRYLVQEIPKTAINDAQLTPTPKPEVEIRRKPHKRTMLLSVGELGPHLAQCHLGQGLPPYQVVSWSIQPFGHNIPTLQDRQTDTQTDRQTDNDPTAQNEPFYKQSPNNSRIWERWDLVWKREVKHAAEVASKVGTGIVDWGFMYFCKLLFVFDEQEFSLRRIKSLKALQSCRKRSGEEHFECE